MTRPIRPHLEVLGSLVALTGRAVDIGAGRGAFAARLAKAGLTVIAVEPQAALLRAAQCPQLSVLAAVAEALPLADRSLDLALFTNSLHHVPMDRQAAALDEAVRVTRPGGHLVVREPLAEGPVFELLRPIDDETEVRTFAQGELERLGDRAGVRLATAIDYDAPSHYAGFAAFRDHIIAADPARATAVAAREAALREGYLALAHHTERGDQLTTPTRVHAFEVLD